ncbi:1823_t:CDS:1, partial [Funneliformis geosporum]
GRESHFSKQMYNILSIEISLNASTLASFYHHQKSPRRTFIDKIIE